MSAEVIAADLGLDLYVVNLATVVDKYIGETEKNLDRIFAEADNVNGVLLFDEADALFGQRSEVRDSHDRYANIEVAYLLQRMETFDGLAILSTNLRSNIDDAFTRRLDVDRRLPDARSPTAPAQLWEHVPRRRCRVADDLDLDFCAEAFELSGGNIRSIAVTLGLPGRGRATGPIDMADVDPRRRPRSTASSAGSASRPSSARTHPLLPPVARVARPTPVRATRATRRSVAAVRCRAPCAAHGHWLASPPIGRDHMPTYLSPGVYVEEVQLRLQADRGRRARPSPRSSGWRRKGPANAADAGHELAPVRREVRRHHAGAYLGHAVYGYFLNGGGNCYVVRVGADERRRRQRRPARRRGPASATSRCGRSKPGPEGNDTTIEVSDPPEGSPEGTVRIVITRGDEREEHEAAPAVRAAATSSTRSTARGSCASSSTRRSASSRTCRAASRRSAAASSSTST